MWIKSLSTVALLENWVAAEAVPITLWFKSPAIFEASRTNVLKSVKRLLQTTSGQDIQHAR